jgi:DNA mismatch repair protein MutS2
MRCDAKATRIGSFKEITAIIEDPQNDKNDTSTFAGRMREFSKLFGKNNLLVGVDEIELGTDADEAASLFRVLLEELRKREITFIVTTHHKRLASLMAGEEEVELVRLLTIMVRMEHLVVVD